MARDLPAGLVAVLLREPQQHSRRRRSRDRRSFAGGRIVSRGHGGKLEGDSWSDPRDESGYSAHDLISLGFINSSEHLRRVEESKPLDEISVDVAATRAPAWTR